MNYEVHPVTVSEQPIAAARQRAAFRKISQEIGDLLGFPWALIRQRSDLRTNGDNVAIYWDETGGGSMKLAFKWSVNLKTPQTWCVRRRRGEGRL
jgi:hypothetical protein